MRDLFDHLEAKPGILTLRPHQGLCHQYRMFAVNPGWAPRPDYLLRMDEPLLLISDPQVGTSLTDRTIRMTVVIVVEQGEGMGGEMKVVKGGILVHPGETLRDGMVHLEEEAELPLGGKEEMNGGDVTYHRTEHYPKDVEDLLLMFV